jgi:hypothetical protein
MLAGLLAVLGAPKDVCRAADTPPAPAPEPSTDSSVNVERRIDVGLAGLNLYSTFGCIGLVAEGWEAELYDVTKVERITGDISRASSLSIQMLYKLIEGDPNLAKTTPIPQMIECYQLLDRQAKLLAEAAKSGDENVVKEFRRVRDECWVKTKAVLGIKE